MRQIPRHRQFGLSLVEMVAVLAITSVVLGSAAPQMIKSRGVHALNQAAAQLRTDIQLARSTAVALNQSVRLHIADDAAGSCYVIHTGSQSACTCNSGLASCTGNGTVLRSAFFAAGQPVSVKANVTSMLFDTAIGTVTPTGTVKLGNQSGDQLNVVVNIMGRSRTCRAAGSITGHEAC